MHMASTAASSVQKISMRRPCGGGKIEEDRIASTAFGFANAQYYCKCVH
jgi:hypothetical protein